MAKYRVISKGSLITVKCRLSKKDGLNERELLYLAEHYTRGLFKITYDGKKSLEYTAPMSVPLEKYIKNKILPEDIFWKIIAQIVEIVGAVERSGLRPGNLWLDMQTVFVNEITGELYFIYQPFIRLETTFSALALIKDITYGEIKKSKGTTGEYLSCFQRFLDFGNYYHLQQIGEYIAKVSPRVYEKTGVKPPRAEEGTVCLEESDTMVLTQEEEEEGATVLLTASLQAELVSRKRGQRIRIHGQEFSLGKSPENAYCIQDNSAISRKHAVIKSRDGDFYISDLGSTNGTFLNGRRLSVGEEAKLQDKDEIVLADEEFAVEIG